MTAGYGRAAPIYDPGDPPLPPCAVCGGDDRDCVCPECDVCGERGDPSCYAAGSQPAHGLVIADVKPLIEARERDLEQKVLAEQRWMAEQEARLEP